jgi:hypothetical protein
MNNNNDKALVVYSWMPSQVVSPPFAVVSPTTRYLEATRNPTLFSRFWILFCFSFSMDSSLNAKNHLLM